MPQRKSGKKGQKAAFAEVEEFAVYLDQIIKVRMSENHLIRTIKVGKSKLTTYLEGEEVPHERVLEYYFLKPLEGFRPLTADERTGLMERYQDACRVQSPKSPTSQDQVNFLEEDLAAARKELADLNERLDSALNKHLADGAEIARLRQDRVDLRAQVKELTTQAGSLRSKVDESATYQAKMQLEGASRELAEFERVLDACQQKITTLEAAVSGHMATNIKLQKLVHRLERERDDDRCLFMELVNHVGNGRVVARMSKTIGQQTEIIMNLTETTKALERERDLLAQELEFARAATPDAPLAEGAPHPGPAQGAGGDTPTAPMPFPDVPAAVVPRPREPQEQRRDGDVADTTPDVMSRARAQFSTSPTAGGGDHPGEVA